MVVDSSRLNNSERRKDGVGACVLLNGLSRQNGKSRETKLKTSQERSKAGVEKLIALTCIKGRRGRR